MTAASDARFGLLQRIFADIASDQRRDPLEHLLILTYEFDDQQLANLLAARNLADNLELQRNQLKFIADMQPVVIYDARKTREFNRIPHFLDLLPVRPGAWRCHHAKAYLFVTRDTVRLVLGSFNLTRTGLFENREVFTEFLWSATDTAELAVLRDFSRLLREGYAEWAQPGAASSREAIAATLDARVARWQPSVPPAARHHLLSSGYARLGEPDGLTRLAALWRTVSDAPPRTVLAVSPFFDRGQEYLADALARALGRPETLHLVTDELNITRLGRRHFGTAQRPARCRLSLIPTGIGDAERDRIMRANDGTRLEGLELRRALHAKILVLCSGSRHLVYCGSANFTLKAWDGANQELGVVTVADGPADTVIAQVLTALAADPDDAFARLGEAATATDEADDEAYQEQPAYPDFINRIRLEQAADGESLVFHFDTATPARLQDYVISWGRVELVIEGAASQPLPPRQAYMPLHGGRNLRFTLRTDPACEFLLPFFHAEALTRQQDMQIFPSAEDWMRHYLQPGGSGGGNEGEFLPGEETAPALTADTGVDRDANVVIAMQRYLNLFAAVEAAFDQRARELAAQPPADATARERALEQGFRAPLRLYARLLEQESRAHRGGAGQDAYLFRLGELVLLCTSLSAHLPALAPLARELANGLGAPAVDATQVTYLDFVRTQLPHG